MHLLEKICWLLASSIVCLGVEVRGMMVMRPFLVPEYSEKISVFVPPVRV